MAKRKYIGAILTLKDNMSATLKGVRKEQKQFKKDVEATRKALESTYRKKRNLRLNNTAAMKKIKQTRKALEPLRKKVVTAVAYKDMIKRKLNKTKNTLKTFSRKVFSPAIKLKDKTKSVFSSIKKKIFSLKGALAGLAIGAGLTTGVSKALGAGSKLEQQMISMEHFIGKNNQDKSQQDIKKMTESYMKNLRENANSTPFTTNEIIAAGTRAINIAGGDTKKAMDIVKLAENMAALNPEKSLQDAIEALADLKVGETERLKEFGFKITQEDIKKAGGVRSIVDKQLKPFFEGGAEKLSKSSAGLWSTIKGKLGSKLQDTGLNILEKLKPQMEGAIALIDKFSPTLDRWSQKIGDGIGFALDKFGSFINWIGQYMPVAKDVIGNVSSWISEKFGWIRGETSNLKGSFKSGFKIIGNAIRTAWKIGKPALDLIASGIKILYYTFKTTFPYIKSIVKTTWSIIEPILSKIGDALSWVADKAGKIAEWLGKKLDNKEDNKGGTNKVKEVYTPYIHGSHASGLKRVPFDGYIAKLHKGERVLTRKEAAEYRKHEIKPIIQPVIQKLLPIKMLKLKLLEPITQNVTSNSSNLTPQDVNNESQETNKTFEIKFDRLLDKLAETIVIREEADIERIVDALARKLEQTSLNYGGVY